VRKKHALQLFKTDLCKLFQQGMCKHGELCAFAHNTDEVRHKPDLTRTSMCRVVLQGGVCRSPQCSFAHDKEQLRTTCGFFKTRMCNYARSGKCRSGDACRFAHVPEELPKALGTAEPLPPTAKKVILVCTNGALEQENVLATLSRGLGAAAQFLPVLLDDDFRFPTACFAREHAEMLQKVAGTVSGATALGEAVGDIFKIVALPFHADAATELALNSQALEIAERLRRSERHPREHHRAPAGTARPARPLSAATSPRSSLSGQGVGPTMGDTGSPSLTAAGADSCSPNAEAGECTPQRGP